MDNEDKQNLSEQISLIICVVGIIFCGITAVIMLLGKVG